MAETAGVVREGAEGASSSACCKCVEPRSCTTTTSVLVDVIDHIRALDMTTPHDDCEGRCNERPEEEWEHKGAADLSQQRQESKREHKRPADHSDDTTRDCTVVEKERTKLIRIVRAWHDLQQTARIKEDRVRRALRLFLEVSDSVEKLQSSSTRPMSTTRSKAILLDMEAQEQQGNRRLSLVIDVLTRMTREQLEASLSQYCSRSRADQYTSCEFSLKRSQEEQELKDPPARWKANRSRYRSRSSVLLSSRLKATPLSPRSSRRPIPRAKAQSKNASTLAGGEYEIELDRRGRQQSAPIASSEEVVDEVNTPDEAGAPAYAAIRISNRTLTRRRDESVSAMGSSRRIAGPRLVKEALTILHDDGNDDGMSDSSESVQRQPQSRRGLETSIGSTTSEEEPTFVSARGDSRARMHVSRSDHMRQVQMKEERRRRKKKKTVEDDHKEISADVGAVRRRTESQKRKKKSRKDDQIQHKREKQQKKRLEKEAKRKEKERAKAWGKEVKQFKKHHRRSKKFESYEAKRGKKASSVSDKVQHQPPQQSPGKWFLLRLGRNWKKITRLETEEKSSEYEKSRSMEKSKAAQLIRSASFRLERKNRSVDQVKSEPDAEETRTRSDHTEGESDVGIAYHDAQLESKDKGKEKEDDDDEQTLSAKASETEAERKSERSTNETDAEEASGVSTSAPSLIKAPRFPTLFGRALSDVMSSQRQEEEELGLPSFEYPYVLYLLCSSLIKRISGDGSVEGLFKVPGKPLEVERLKKQLDARDFDLRAFDSHALASCLELWLLNLPGTIVPEEFYNECVKNANRPDQTLLIIERIPSVNKWTMWCLCELVRILTEPEALVKISMGSADLAQVFAPAILRCADTSIVFYLSTFEEMFVSNLFQSYASAGLGLVPFE